MAAAAHNSTFTKNLEAAQRKMVWVLRCAGKLVTIGSEGNAGLNKHTPFPPMFSFPRITGIPLVTPEPNRQNDLVKAFSFFSIFIKEPVETMGSSSASSSQRTRKRAFPFTTIIVTNPDEKSARSAQSLLDSTLKRYLARSHRRGRDVKIISTCDPYGARCGSFGGTLAALELIPDRKHKNDDSMFSETVLCLHAGGDSSRCPLSMILGKAWTNLPSAEYRNPIAWLISQLEDLFYEAQIPKGSLLVTATDCLISLGGDEERRQNFVGDDTSDCQTSSTTTAQDCSDVLDPYAVLGVAVPAPLTTAKNHGVYVMPEKILPNSEREKESSSSTASTTFQIDDPVDVWQKPSVDQMLANNAPKACFEVYHRSGPQAWIDVGIVIFCPGAFQTLAELSKGLLALCTRKGLEASHTTSCNSGSLEAFAKQNALKVDLYTDILHNLPIGDPSPSSPEEIASDNGFQTSLKRAMSALSLRVLVVPQGSFLHLGTTQELVEFITTSYSCNEGNNAALATSTANSTTVPTIMDQHVTQNLARALQLNHRFKTFPVPGGDESDKKTSRDVINTTLCSTFPSNQTKLGSSTFVEYSDLRGYESVTIENHCMLSGWRRKHPVEGAVEKSLNIPDGMSVQLLPLTSSSEEEEKWVMMVIGTTDPIKTLIQNSEIYGVPFPDFVDLTGISYDAIGFRDKPAEKDSIWTANIHPIVRSSIDGNNPSISFSSLFGWVEKLRDKDPNLSSDKSFSNWLSAERISLSNIHGVADASKEWKYRMELERTTPMLVYQKHLDEVVGLLRDKCQTVPCNLQWLTEMKNTDENSSFAALSALVDTLEELILEEFSRNNYDICGRALMLASASIADLSLGFIVDDNNGDKIPINQASNRVMELITALKVSQPTGRIKIIKDIFELRKFELWNTTGNSLSNCWQVMERLAQCMIEFTIEDGFRNYQDPCDTTKFSLQRTSKTIYNKYVLSVAPVRVDLAGGWSDTPPITYEYGGSVTGMAVLVDGHFPLSCRCRVVSGRTGMLLKTELRDVSDGSLLSSRQEEVTKISELKDFRDPAANCALLKAALVCLGMVSEEEIRLAIDIQQLINQFCSSHDNVRIEIVTTSLLGLGTGMGTSSILGACVLQSLAECVGIGKMTDKFLIHAVLMLEQLLSSGGGWQDQAHGIVPGIKTVTSAPKIPLEIEILPQTFSNMDIKALEDRLLFAYTGKTRLAKNILQQVLRRWSRRTNEIVETVGGLVKCSSAIQSALENKSWNDVGALMYKSYKLKCVMAGENSGAEPESVKLFISEMMSRDQIQGAMLCGAGGGGFLLLLMSPNVDRKSVECIFEKHILPQSEDFASFSFHDCQIAQTGLTTSILPDQTIETDAYKLSWQSPNGPN